MAVEGDPKGVGPAVSQARGWRPSGIEIIAIAMVALWLAQSWLIDRLANPALQTASTIFVSIIVQAAPFLVLGVLLSACIHAFVPASFWSRALPRNQALSVPVAAGAGLVLPGCECASVPVAGSLIQRGVAPSSALAFLLAAPAINPIVVVSTLVAFPGQPEVALARVLASIAVAIGVGWIWLRLGKDSWLRLSARHDHLGQSSMTVFIRSAAHDLVHAGGYLVVGAAFAAVFNTLVPVQVLDSIAGNFLLSVLVLALMAAILSICSEADAFVAASFSSFSPTAKLAFMVVGPMVDLKLIAMQAGVFGRSFAIRFAPLVFILAVLASLVVGLLMLGDGQ